ncbi:MAG: PqiC family protein [Rhodospirillaceae bacterium]
MIKPRRLSVSPVRLSIMLSILLTAGCATLPPPNLYVLSSPLAATTPAAATAAATPASTPRLNRPLMVALGPITVPDYLDRTDIVRRATDNRMATEDGARWAEPLRSGLQRALVADLAGRLGSGYWVTISGTRSADVDFEVPLDVETFEPDATGRVVMIASWEIRTVRDGANVMRQVMRQRVNFEHAMAVPGVEAQVRAMSAAVADLGASIVANMTKSLPKSVR